jgi:tetratricopeptide (TPR) repeat protein
MKNGFLNLFLISIVISYSFADEKLSAKEYKAFLKKALNLLKQEKYEDSKKLFENEINNIYNKNKEKSIITKKTDVKKSFLKEALRLLELKEYQKAKIEFEKEFEQNPSNPQVSFYLGICLFKMGLYEDALVSYERVLILDENHNLSKLELARTYLKLNMPFKAKDMFKEVLSKNPPLNVKNNINNLLQQIDKKIFKSKTSIFLSLGLGRDSNMNTQPDIGVMESYLSDNNLTDVDYDKPITKNYSQQILNISRTDPINENLSFNNSILVYNKYYNDDEYNILYSKLSSSLNYYLNQYMFSFPIGYSKVVSGANTLLHNYEGGVKVSTKLTKSSLLDIYSNYRKKMYKANEDKSKNSNTIEYGLNVKNVIDSHTITLGYIHSKEYKQNIDNINYTSFVDKLTDTFKINYFIDVYKYFNLNLGYSFSNIDYYSDSRNDEIKTYSISVSKPIDKNKNISINYSDTENSSDSQTPLSYNKKDINLKFNITF